MNVKFKKIHPDAKLPIYATEEAAGADICSIEDVSLIGEQAETGIIVSTGLQLAHLDPGYEIQVRSRSGLASKGVAVANSPGTIDSDYRGEIKVILVRHGNQSMFLVPNLPKGSRIAQLVVVPVKQATFEFSEDVSETIRGSDGFGSTGT